MKLEKVLSRPRKGRWVILFVLGLGIAAVMATSYNVEIVKRVRFEGIPWGKIIFGGIGFFIIIGALVLFFTRLLSEMKISQIQADFLDRISHELRTPLSTLSLVSDLLKRKEENNAEEEAKLWNSHDTELNRLKTDVELLLQAARLRESRLKVDFEQIQLVDWLQSKWPSFQALLGKDAVLTLSGDPIRKKVLVDPSLFELILRNLLDNARKFSMGRTVVEMKTHFFPAAPFFGKDRWQITVKDQGFGFSPEMKVNLFKRFSRLDVKSNELKTVSIPGTGLGLYLSASASKAMGLTLTGQSLGEGKGAEFKIEGRFP